MKSQQTKIETPTPPLKRYRVLNSVGRRLFASFDTEEEAFSYIMEQSGPSCRFAIEDTPEPERAPSLEQARAREAPRRLARTPSAMGEWWSHD